jgi:hypothetical protein
MKKIDLIGIMDTLDIVIDGKRYILVDDLAEVLFADNVFMYEYIEEHEEEFENHLVEVDDGLAIDFEGLNKFDLVGFYQIYVDCIKEALRMRYKLKKDR